jgi:NADPH-dependent 2,4-dienoyl-CoA reductase/sulfur reductase-like enzyme
MKASFDVVIVGGGPGGIAATVIAAEAGMQVCLLDDNGAPGGQIWRGAQAQRGAHLSHGREFHAWIDRLQRTNCAVWLGWQAIALHGSHVLRVEREDEVRDLEFKRLVIATGARERFLPFPGWTLPGVMGAGGMQAFVRSGLDPRGKRVVVAGTGPLLLAIAAGLSDAGATIAGIFEQAPLGRLLRFGLALTGQPQKLVEGARYRGKTQQAPYRTGTWVKRVEGAGHVERVFISDGRKERMMPCDWLASGFHLVPNLELPNLLGCGMDGGYVAVDERQQSSVPGIACVGELTGVGGVEKALLEGQVAGWAAAGNEAKIRANLRRLKRHRRFAQQLDSAFALRDELRKLSDAETVVCRCEDVLHAELTKCSSWREAKLHTRCGMGACQGRICGGATEFLFGWKCGGTRPPIFPAAVSAVAARVDSPEPVHL